MADNVDISPGSGRTVFGDERTLNGVLGIIQRVGEIGASSIAASSDATVTTTAESVAARETRKRVLFYADEANTANIRVGATGAEAFPIPPGFSLALYTTAAVFYESVSGTQTLYWVEEFDS